MGKSKTKQNGTTNVSSKEEREKLNFEYRKNNFYIF